jgi:hypothetical protein
LLDPGTTSWLGAIPVVAVALLLLFLPGVIAGLALRVPLLTAFATAPGLSTTAVVLISVASSALGVPWGPIPLIIGIVALWLLAGAVGVLLRRYAPREVRGRLPVAVLVATAIAALGVALVLIPVSQTPEAFPQHPDTIFHLGAAQWMVEHHDASVLHALAFASPTGTGFYPAAFHAMVATIAELSGAAVVVATSSFVLVIAGVVWPLGCVFLARTLLGTDLAVTLSAGVVSVAFSAYPYMVMGYGVLWPTLFGQTLVPAALALLAVMMSAAHRQSPPLASKLGATVLLLVTLPGLAVAHVNALVTLVLFSYLMVAGVVLRKASDLRASRPLLAAASVVGLVLATGLAFFGSTVNSSKAASMLKFGAPGPELGHRESLHDVLLFARRDEGALWVLAALVAVGACIILVRYRGRRWLVAALAVTSALLYLNLAVDNHTVRLFTWPWNNQSVRLATMVVLPATLLATVALAAGAQLLRSRVAPLTRVTLPPWAPAVAVVTIFVVATGGAYVDTHRRALNPYFHPTTALSWASNEELGAMHRLARLIPPGAVVAENPWNGGSYMYVVSGRHMLFPTEKSRWPGDPKLLALKLDDVGRSPAVCAAARRRHVTFAMTGGRPFSWAGPRGTTQYVGVDAVGSSDAFRKVAKDGPYTLYRMVQCAKA